MTPEHLLTNHRDRLEATAKHFGISVEQAAVQIAEELTLREARRTGAPDWMLDMARATQPTCCRRSRYATTARRQAQAHKA